MRRANTTVSISGVCYVSSPLLAQESKLVLVLITRLTSQFGVDTSALGVRSERTTKEKNVGFRSVELVKRN